MGRTIAIALVFALAVLVSPASAEWMPPTDVAPANPANKPVGAPSVAMARDGTTFVAFLRYDGANLRTAVAMQSPGGGFGPVRDLSPAGQDASSPAVAVDRQGNATLVWIQAPAFNLQARFRPAGGDWGDSAPLSAGPNFAGPSLAVGDNGGAVAAWWTNTGGAHVEASVRLPGSQTFVGPLTVSVVGSSSCQSPHVAIDAAGDVVAIWTRRTDAGSYLVESAVKAAGAAAFAAQEPRSPTSNGNSNCNSDIQMTPDGRVTAMWDFTTFGQPSATFYSDRGTPFAAGTWSQAKPLAANSTKPIVALDDAGNAATTWLTTTPTQIVSAVRTGTGTFSTPKPLSGASDIGGQAQAVAASANGDALVTYVGTSNGTRAIFAARRRVGGEFGDIMPVATTPPGNTVSVGVPDVALDDQGNAFAVWQRSVSATSVTTAQIAAFDPVPPVITAADVPATATVGQPAGMSAAASDRMSSPAIRFEFGDGGGADGASVQHVYALPGTYTVTVTAADAAGNRSGTTRAIQVAPAPVQPSGAGPRPTGPQHMTATTSASWDRLRNGRTRMKTLKVENLAGPETVKLACKGRRKGCRKSLIRTVTKHGKTVNFTKFAKGVTLRPKAVLTITVTRPGYITRVITYTMVNRRDPKKATRCLPPGAKKPTAC